MPVPQYLHPPEIPFSVHNKKRLEEGLVLGQTFRLDPTQFANYTMNEMIAWLQANVPGDAVFKYDPYSGVGFIQEFRQPTPQELSDKLAAEKKQKALREKRSAAAKLAKKRKLEKDLKEAAQLLKKHKDVLPEVLGETSDDILLG